MKRVKEDEMIEYDYYTYEFKNIENIIQYRFSDYWRTYRLPNKGATVKRPVYQIKGELYIGEEHFWDSDGQYVGQLPHKYTVLYEDVLREFPYRKTV